ncbi:MAG TPA: hypothetical protein ACFCUC_04715, partial [Desulfobacterales bacterium]
MKIPDVLAAVQLRSGRVSKGVKEVPLEKTVIKRFVSTAGLVPVGEDNFESFTAVDRSRSYRKNFDINEFLIEFE